MKVVDVSNYSYKVYEPILWGCSLYTATQPCAECNKAQNSLIPWIALYKTKSFFYFIPKKNLLIEIGQRLKVFGLDIKF